MTYQITKGERAMVLRLVINLEGVNRTDGRIVASLEKVLRLDEAGTVLAEEVGDQESFDLSELESKWITDHINTSFEKSQMPPRLATLPSLSRKNFVLV